MRAILCFAMVWPIFAFAKAHKEQCSFPPRVAGEAWNLFWAQHYVGADLLRQDIEKMEVDADTVRSLIGIWDTSQRNHGEYVSHLVAGPTPAAVIPLDQALAYFKGDIFTACLERSSCLPYINYSMEWLENYFLADMAFRLSSKGSTLITSADNDRSAVGPAKSGSAREGNIILVTSLAPSGHPSSFTNYADSTTVAVPSDRSMRSYDFEGEAGIFGGTSGAAPLVTGALGGFSLLSGYALGTREIERLLKKTAIPLAGLPRSNLIGAGMLNAYKIGRVADRLTQRCGEKKECMASLLKTEELYDFDGEFDWEGVAFDQLGPCQKTAAFSDLRRAAFLNPQRAELWREIARVKEKYFSGGAEFYLSLAQRVGQTDRELLIDICRGGKKARLAKYLGEADLASLLSFPFCHAETLKHVAGALFADWVLDSESLAKSLLKRPEIDSPVLASLASLSGSHAHKLADLGGLLNAIFAHEQTNSLVLASMADAVGKNFEEWGHSREFVGQIFAHQKIGSAVLASLSAVVSKNFDKFMDAEKFLNQILGHEKVDGLALVRLAGAVSINYNKMSSPEKFLEQILAHRKTDARVLAIFIYAVKKNALGIVALEKLLRGILGHPSVDWHILNNLARITQDHAGRIEGSQELLERISLELKSSQ